MLRSILLYLAGAGWAKTLITRFFVARRVARRFIAGETLAEAVPVVKKLNADGLVVTLDYLGESVTSTQDASEAADQYIRILDTIASNNLQATVSLKLTQFGLDISEDTCLFNLRRIVEHARQLGNHVTIDMESHEYTDATLRIFREMHHAFGRDHVGTVIQAYLYRSEQDMADLKAEGAFVRLCKGAYKEPPDVAFARKADVDANYIKLMEAFVNTHVTPSETYLGVATHDARIIDAMRAYAARVGIPRNRFEFQMLYGIRTDLQRKLVQEGYTTRIYVPFGTQWYPYFMRRLAERPANLWFFISNFFRP